MNAADCTVSIGAYSKTLIGSSKREEALSKHAINEVFWNGLNSQDAANNDDVISVSVLKILYCWDICFFILREKQSAILTEHFNKSTSWELFVWQGYSFNFLCINSVDNRVYILEVKEKERTDRFPA